MPPRARPPAGTAQEGPTPFTPTAWDLGQYAPVATRARSETQASDVPGGRPRCPAGPLAHQLQMENQGHLLAIPWRACSETLPGHDEASGGHAPDCFQQLFYEAQLLQGAASALGRKHRTRSLTRHAGCPRRTAHPDAASGKEKPGLPAPCSPPAISRTGSGTLASGAALTEHPVHAQPWAVIMPGITLEATSAVETYGSVCS